MMIGLGKRVEKSGKGEGGAPCCRRKSRYVVLELCERMEGNTKLSSAQFRKKAVALTLWSLIAGHERESSPYGQFSEKSLLGTIRLKTLSKKFAKSVACFTLLVSFFNISTSTSRTHKGVQRTIKLTNPDTYACHIAQSQRSDIFPSWALARNSK